MADGIVKQVLLDHRYRRFHAGIAIGIVVVATLAMTYWVLPRQPYTKCKNSDGTVVSCTSELIASGSEICTTGSGAELKETFCSIDFSVIRTEIWKILLLIVAGLATALVSWVGGKVFGERKNIAAFRPKAIQEGERKNTILMVGLGRVGKTSLIRALISDGSKEPIKLTQGFDVYKYSNENDSVTTRFYITDYKGQTLRQLVENFIKAQLVPNSDLRYGDINSLVIVVDLFPWKEGEPDDRQFTEINQARVEEHINDWSRTAIDAVFGLLTRDELQLVCLFINKLDSWKTGHGADAKEAEVKKWFKPMIHDLQQRTQPNGPDAEDAIQFKVIVGSVLKGQGVSGADHDSLRNLLAAHSLPTLGDGNGQADA